MYFLRDLGFCREIAVRGRVKLQRHSLQQENRKPDVALRQNRKG